MISKHSSPRHNPTLVSDEENTSEYSHDPSSQHSTLESNPDIVQRVLNHNKKLIQSHQYDEDSSSDDENNNKNGDDIPNIRSIPA